MNSKSDDNPGVRLVEVTEDREGQRLDNFLLGQWKGVPRTHVYRLLRTGQVRVNGRRAKADQRLESGDTVRLPPVRQAESAPAGVPSRAQRERLAAAIIEEDRDFLALNKPSGVASHGGSGVAFGVIETLRALRPEATLELVHRLDRETSGVLLLALRRAALRAVQASIREGRVEKRYLALLVGTPRKPKFTVDVPLKRGEEGSSTRMVEVHAEGKASLSHFTLVERYRSASLYQVDIETGRTHQIRVHAAHIGHPVAGDDKYGDWEANRRLREQCGLKRLFLHASALAFPWGEDGERVFSAPLPEDLKSVLDALQPA
ncbi:MAG TPA: RluA family pseudouridine synthase [Xanthomonadaceae bacterium]|nr:RluA family pseudouridine synthase [Xanthomonadaceae bacterium]